MLWEKLSGKWAPTKGVSFPNQKRGAPPQSLGCAVAPSPHGQEHSPTFLAAAVLAQAPAHRVSQVYRCARGKWTFSRGTESLESHVGFSVLGKPGVRGLQRGK